MTDFLYSAGGFLLAIGILVTIHEFGHFWVARKLGVKVLRFSIGFGRPLATRIGAVDSTEYVIGAIPLGGYVKMLDEREGDVDSEEIHRTFNRQSLAVRSAIVVAGPAANFIFAIVAYWAILAIGVPDLPPVVGKVDETSIAWEAGFRQGDVIETMDERPVQAWAEHRLYFLNQVLSGESVRFHVNRDGIGTDLVLHTDQLSGIDPGFTMLEAKIGLRPDIPPLTPIIGNVLSGTPAEQAGIVEGDIVTALDGVPVESWYQVVAYIVERPGTPIEATVSRGAETLVMTLTPESAEVDGRVIGRIGVMRAEEEGSPVSVVRVELGFLDKTVRAVETTWLMSVVTLKMLARMITREVSTDNISGPLTIAHFAGQTAQIGLVQFITFLAVISISLGILNLLPIPLLDGGHLLYFLIEAIKGSPVSENFMYRGQQVGILIIAALMSLAFYNDIVRLLT